MNGITNLQQTKYPDFIITFDIANSIVDILIKHCGVAANRKKFIVEDLMWGGFTDKKYKFQSDFNQIYILDNELYLTYYSSVSKWEIEEQLREANTKLSELYNKYAVSNKIS